MVTSGPKLLLLAMSYYGSACSRDLCWCLLIVLTTWVESCFEVQTLCWVGPVRTALGKSLHQTRVLTLPFTGPEIMESNGLQHRRVSPITIRRIASPHHKLDIWNSQPHSLSQAWEIWLCCSLEGGGPSNHVILSQLPLRHTYRALSWHFPTSTLYMTY